MDVEKLVKDIVLSSMTPEQQESILSSVKDSIKQAKEIQKQKIGENVNLVIQALKKIENDIQDKYDAVTANINKRISSIKDGKDGIDGKDGRDGKDGLPGNDGLKGDKGDKGDNGRDGKDGIDGVSVLDAKIDFDGSLVISLSNGREINVGEVVPPDIAEKIKVINTMSTNAAVEIKDEGNVITSGVTSINFTGSGVTATASGDAVTVNVTGGGGGGGDVTGPASSTDNAIVRFDGTTGKLVQNSVVTIADTTGDISGVGQLNATTLDATNIEVTNIKAKDGTVAATIADSTGKITVSTELAVDNLNLSGNAITSTDTNGNIDLTPNGTGEVNITKVDIDSGAIDGTAIGANSASTGAFTTLTTSSTVTLNGGTANGVLYLNASKVVTSGSAFTFDGTTLATTGNVTLGDDSTDTVTVNGYMGVGGAVNAQYGVIVSSAALSGTSQIGAGFFPVATSAATSAVRGISVTPATAAASFTVGEATGALFANVSKGAGSTITSQRAIYILDQTNGTNNYGIESQVSSGANKWNIYASGTATNYFAGNVGIGTNAPYKTLHVRAAASGATSTTSLAHLVVEFNGNTGLNILTPNTASGYITFGDPENASVGRIQYEHTANYMAMFTNGTERMRLDSSGNLGIGTASPGARLDITSSAAFTARFSGPVNTYVEVTDGTGSFKAQLISNSPFLTSVGSYPMIFGTNNTERMRVDTSGNLGIGTASPANRLDIVNSASGAQMTIAGSDGQFAGMFGGTGSNGPGIFFLNTAPALRFGTGTAKSLGTFTELMRIDSSGNVGIGTASAITKLDVNGTSLFRNTQYTYQPAPTALTGNVTLTAAQILTRIITTTGGSATITMPTGSTLDSGLPSSFPNDGAFDFTIINTDSGQDSLAANTGVTIVGSGAVGASSSGTFRLRKTGTATYVVYRLS